MNTFFSIALTTAILAAGFIPGPTAAVRVPIGLSTAKRATHQPTHAHQDYTSVTQQQQQQRVRASNDTGCNGQGMWYPDTQVCECYQCFQGPDCSQPVMKCNVKSEGGNPRFLGEWWLTQLENATTTMLASYRVGYQITQPWVSGQQPPGIASVLDKVIRDLHAAIGNIKTDNAYIVAGAGCTQLIAAAQYALSVGASGKKIVFSQSPYYDGYQNWASTGINGVTFNASLSQDGSKVIEFVTIPNNPDGLMRQAYFNNSAQVHDMVYNWPSVAENPTQGAAFPIMLFSLSKLSGHAGTRFGWAVVQDKTVAENMQRFIQLNSIAISIESQYRAFNILTYLLQQKDVFFPYISAVMKARWDNVQLAFNTQSPANRFSLLSKPGSFYAWVKCNSDSDCVSVFSAGGVTGESGVGFGSDPQHLRLELVLPNPVWPIFMFNLRNVLKSGQ